MIFLDNASTTKVCTPALEIVRSVSEQLYYNPSALYGEALKVKNLLEVARKDIANILGSDANEIYFTSCATESNNWAFEKGIKNRKGNIVVSSSEHASAYECAILQKSKGIDVRFLSLNKNGTVNEDDLYNKVDENTCFASIIHCSNETGAVNDIAKLSKIIRGINNKVIIHSDGVQAFAKLGFNIKSLGVDMYSMSAHKIGGLKGCGALFIKKGLNLAPFISGGGQERGLRSGTENVAGILSFAEAAKYFKQNYDSGLIKQMRGYLIQELKPLNVIINGTADAESILSVTVPGIKAEILQHMLSDKGVLIGLGSACSSKAKNNRVLSAIGLSPKEIEGSIRISFGLENNMEQIKIAAELIKTDITTLRGNIK
ncbi:MAG: cysteine desulfurase [Clostridiales bacterium]|nr:cysteine desulfurase [Clostridiales bacterium]